MIPTKRVEFIKQVLEMTNESDPDAQKILTSPPFSTAVLSVLAPVYPSHPKNQYFKGCINDLDKGDLHQYGTIIPNPFIKFMKAVMYMSPESPEALAAQPLVILLTNLNPIYSEYLENKGKDEFDQSFEVEDEDMRIKDTTNFYTRPAPNRNK
jgi:hypothetical protein